ncbi:alpha/beta hydrolase [Amycolatopsis sp.]|jgi:pimeloyl-ACP methyl ester carboxylesterase|uniref:esterase/lipase family protein n=1 Tax=Amycolatopsis sp. TaxID=37632 RepID=UPI002E0BC788|nr:alpha/beta hydrolase [Amycolatopsis sp.]
MGGTAADEFGGAARLLSDTAGGITGTVQRMHRAIARRAFGVAGDVALPAKALHDSVSGLVYGSVRTGIAMGGAVVEAASRVAGTLRPEGTLVESPVGQATTGVLNGAFGARAEIRGDLLPSRMTLRVDHRRVPIDTAALAEAYPDASGKLVVFLHGLIETERWWFRAERPDFGTRLTADLGTSQVYFRYNTGKHISENGRELTAVLTELVGAWPVPVTGIVLIGHSMGGLVTRSAVHQAAELPWLPLVTRLVCLGVPHTGAPLERGANLAAWALRRFEESAPLGDLLALRSPGVKDLRYGFLHEEQWTGGDPDAVRRTDTPVDTFLPEGVRQYFLAATLARSENSLLARGLGDLLVMPKSAVDTAQVAERRWVGGMNHFDLMHRDEVYRTLLEWLRDADSP